MSNSWGLTRWNSCAWVGDCCWYSTWWIEVTGFKFWLLFGSTDDEEADASPEVEVMDGCGGKMVELLLSLLEALDTGEDCCACKTYKEQVKSTTCKESIFSVVVNYLWFVVVRDWVAGLSSVNFGWRLWRSQCSTAHNGTLTRSHDISIAGSGIRSTDWCRTIKIPHLQITSHQSGRSHA